MGAIEFTYDGNNYSVNLGWGYISFGKEEDKEAVEKRIETGNVKEGILVNPLIEECYQEERRTNY